MCITRLAQAFADVLVDGRRRDARQTELGNLALLCVLPAHERVKKRLAALALARTKVRSLVRIGSKVVKLFAAGTRRVDVLPVRPPHRSGAGNDTRVAEHGTVGKVAAFEQRPTDAPLVR